MEGGTSQTVSISGTGDCFTFYYRRYKSNIIYNYSFSVAVYLAEHILNFILNETENLLENLQLTL